MAVAKRGSWSQEVMESRVMESRGHGVKSHGVKSHGVKSHGVKSHGVKRVKARFPQPNYLDLLFIFKVKPF